jgi:hypothetical protein
MLSMRQTLGGLAFVFALLLWVAVVAPSCKIENQTVATADQAKNKKAANYECASFGTLFVRKTFDIAHGRDKEIIALSTLAIALFTIILAVASALQYTVLNRSIALARDEFLSTHRPRMRLKAIWLASADGQTSDPELRVQEPLIVRLDIVNFGNTSAFITRLNLAAIFVRADGQLPQRPPYNEIGAPNLEFRPPFELIRGMTFTQAISDGHVLTIDELSEVYHGRRTLYFVGTIDYRDSNGHPMQTAFCRYLRFLFPTPLPQDRGRFETDKNPHYEYQD